MTDFTGLIARDSLVWPDRLWVSEAEISTALEQFPIPGQLASYWRQNGFGCYGRDRYNGNLTSNDNWFMGPTDLRHLLSWHRCSDGFPFGAGFPFFVIVGKTYYENDDTKLAFIMDDGTILIDGRRVSNSLYDFIDAILDDPHFPVKDIGGADLPFSEGT